MDVLEAGPLPDLGRATALGAKVVKSPVQLGPQKDGFLIEAYWYH